MSPASPYAAACFVSATGAVEANSESFNSSIVAPRCPTLLSLPRVRATLIFRFDPSVYPGKTSRWITSFRNEVGVVRASGPHFVPD